MPLAFARPLALLSLPLAALALAALSRGVAGKPRRLLALRLAAAALVALAAAGPRLHVEGAGTSTVLLVDRSRSCAVDEAALAAALREARARLGPEDELVPLAFAGGVSAAAPGSLEVPADPPGRDRTDIGRAIQAALAFLDPARARRVVAVTDGEDTAGGLRAALAAALLEGVPVHAVASSPWPAGDFVVRRLDLRERARVGEPVPALLDIVASSTAECRVVVSLDGAPAFEFPLACTPGARRYPLPLVFEKPGFVRVEAELVAPGDAEPRNNRTHGFIDVGEPARILYVTDKPDPPAWRALAAIGAPVRRVGPGSVGGNARELASLAAVVLDDVSAADLSPAACRAVASAVREGGAGLVIFGGGRSFGQGGWRGTDLEAVSPLAADLMNDTLLKKVALVFLLDKSGSMEGATLGVAKAALVESGRVLRDHDAVGIISFDAAARVSLPLTTGRKDGRLIDTLLDISGGGGTDFHPALERALEMLEGSTAGERHVILLSDGQPSRMDFDAILERYRKAKVTLTTVAVGAGADDTLMRSLSARAGGRFHKAVDLEEVPRIFLGEVEEFKSSYLAEGVFRFTPRGLSAALACLDPAVPLSGYVRTAPMPGAEILATVGEGDPLLAQRRVGAGRSIAFAADSGGRFAAMHAASPGWSEFVRLLVESVTRDPESLAGRLDLREEEEGVAVTSAVPGAARLRVLPPAGPPLEVPFGADGVARFTSDREGAHLLAAFDGAGELLARRGYVNPYSREYRRFGVNRARLREIAAFTGGRHYPAAALPALLAKPEGGARRALDLSPALLALAAFLFLAEIFLRRFGGRGKAATYAPAEAASPAAEPPPPEDPMAALARSKKTRFVRIDKGYGNGEKG